MNNNNNSQNNNSQYPIPPSHCPDHGQCMERQNQLIEDVKELKADMTKAKEEIQSIKLQQVKDREQIDTLYRMYNEVKESIKEINNNMKMLSEKMDNLKSKPDSFKEALQKLGMKMLEWAFMGGLIVYVTKTFIK